MTGDISKASTANKPNVLYIMTDQQRFDTIAALGNSQIYTPNMDRLVKRGVTFTNCYTSCPECVPARHTIRTGCEPPKTLVYGNGYFEKPAPGQAKTIEGRCGAYLAKTMKNLGYRTFGIGKSHTIPWDEELGYDTHLHSEELYESKDQRSRDSYARWIAKEHPEFDFVEGLMGERTEMYYMPQMSPLPAELTVERWAADRAVEQIRSIHNQPYFGLVSFVGPHPPFAPPIPFNRMYDPDKMSNPIKGSLELDHMDEHIPWMNRVIWAEDINDSHARVLKARYYGEFAGKVIRYIRSRGKTVWMDDDMVLGKNIWRKDGFRGDAPKALACIPKDTVMTHWYYQGPTKAHREALERVRRSGRPFVVMPNSYSAKCDFTHLPALTENLAYMARVGKKNGALGYACASWETHLGTSFESTWPPMAMSAEQAWCGGAAVDDDCLRRLSFVLTGETDGALGKFMQALSNVEELLSGDGVKQTASFRKVLLEEGPYWLWRRRSPVLGSRERSRIRRLVSEAKQHYRRIGKRDVRLRTALRLPIVLFEQSLAILEAFDKAWAEYHRAAEIQRSSRSAGQFRTRIGRVVQHIRRAIAATGEFREALRRLESTGQTPCDADALARHEAALSDVLKLLAQVIRRDMPLPYFERLFYLPDSYYVSNLHQLARQNFFHQRHVDLPWPRRRS